MTKAKAKQPATRQSALKLAATRPVKAKQVGTKTKRSAASKVLPAADTSALPTKASGARANSKQARVLALLRSTNGCTIEASQNRRLLRRTDPSYPAKFGRSPKPAAPFRRGCNPANRFEAKKAPLVAAKQITIRPQRPPDSHHPEASVTRGSARRPAAGRYSELSGILPGTGIFGRETGAEKRTNLRTETATHKTRVRKPRQRRAFPIGLYTMTKQ